MNKQICMLLSVLVLIPGCGGLFRSKKVEKRPITQREILTDVDIPVAEDSVKNFFDEDLDELALADSAIPLDTADAQYAWIDQSTSQNGFKKVYFEYDNYAIKADQKDSIAQNIKRIKELLQQEEGTSKEIQLVINGNSDSIFGHGHDAYNRILSEKRAKSLKDQLIAAGIPSNKIKIIGRGSDMPEIISGRPCSGDKDQQAPNRRDEIQIIMA